MCTFNRPMHIASYVCAYTWAVLLWLSLPLANATVCTCKCYSLAAEETQVHNNSRVCDVFDVFCLVDLPIFLRVLLRVPSFWMYYTHALEYIFMHMYIHTKLSKCAKTTQQCFESQRKHSTLTECTMYMLRSYEYMYIWHTLPHGMLCTAQNVSICLLGLSRGLYIVHVVNNIKAQGLQLGLLNLCRTVTHHNDTTQTCK